MTPSTPLSAWTRSALDEIATPLSRVRDEQTEALLHAITGARRIALYGVGREGLMIRALAMRLYHLGLQAYPVGEMNTPPVGEGDWLLASAGPGHFSTVAALTDVAHRHGARVMLLTAQPDSPLAREADVSVVLAASTMAQSYDSATVLPMGSAYEGALFLYFEYLVARLQKALGVSEDAMRARHTNLE